MDDVILVNVKPQLVLGITRTGHYRQIPELIKTLCEFSSEKGIHIIGTPIFMCHESSEKEAMEADKNGTARVEVAIPVAQKVPDEGEIKCYELPGGSMAKITHKGPYEECKPTYDRLFAWIKENKKQITGPIREMYMNDPGEVPKEEITTEIYAPVK